MTDVLYNELDPFACAWLENLCATDLIEPGEVDGTSIVSLHAARLRDRVQAHFFAGIGVWSYALRLAGWPRDLPVWTGSCPCQPFSDAGRRRGTDDKRHLWPVWLKLIAECRPAILFGEQVASKAGRAWLGTVQADLEALGYQFAGADLCAACIGAPHRRQRLFFVATRGLEDSDRERRQEQRLQLQSGQPREALLEAPRGSQASGLAKGHEHGPKSQRRRLSSPPGNGYTRGFWAGADWLYCRDKKIRPVEPGSFPLAHGVAGRVVARVPIQEEIEHWYNRRGALHGFGNAIVPQLAATFVRSVMDVIF